jgi:site-specific DNA-adenine methylase
VLPVRRLAHGPRVQPVNQNDVSGRAPTKGIPMTPSFAYPGGKHYLRKWIVSHFPQAGFTRYVEPFAGRGNVYFHAREHFESRPTFWLNDIATCDFFCTVAALNRDQIFRIVGPGPFTRETYDELRQHRGCAKAILLEPCITYSGGGYGNGFRGGPKAPTVGGFCEKLSIAADILREDRPTFTTWDYRYVLDECGPGDFVYLDPPYKSADVRAYSADELNHADMVNRLRSANFRWALSEYDDPIYREAFGPPTSTRETALVVSGNLMGRQSRMECLWIGGAP